jgi:hypothetical protein
MRSWIAQERIGFSLGVWVTHAVILAIALFLFHRRMNLPQLSFGRLLALVRSLFKPRPRPQAG